MIKKASLKEIIDKYLGAKNHQIEVDGSIYVKPLSSIEKVKKFKDSVKKIEITPKRHDDLGYRRVACL